jgi:hypothetical protein
MMIDTQPGISALPVESPAQEPAQDTSLESLALGPSQLASQVGVFPLPSGPLPPNQDLAGWYSLLLLGAETPVFDWVTIIHQPIGPTDGANKAYVDSAVVGGVAGVGSWNGRTGAVTMTAADLTAAGGLLLAGGTMLGPLTLSGAPTLPLQATTKQYVDSQLAGVVAVTSWNGRTGAVVLTLGDLTAAGGAPILSPALTGTPTAPTAGLGTATSQLATTAFVAAGFLPLTGNSTITGPVTISGSVTLSGSVRMPNLPLSNSGLAAGTLWNNGGFVAVA